MSDNRGALVVEYGWNLVGASYPNLEDVPGIANAFRRRWVLRLSTSLPADEPLENIVKSFVISARRDIAETLGVKGELEQPVPAASVVRLDDHHLVLAIDCPTPEVCMGDAAGIATWSILRAADKQWQLEDLEGIPKRYWVFLTR